MATRTHGTLSLAVATIVALAAALVALAVSGGHDASAHGAGHEHVSADVSERELALRRGLDKLWEDHVTWTRLAVISLTTDAPDTNATVARLLRNQTDLGAAIAPYYGPAAGRQLTALLREHILIAADLIAEARQGDQAGIASQQARWRANADEIASFLSSANPRSWKPAPMKAMMRSHLRLTTNEVVARLERRWEADVRAYDRIHVQILHMSEMLADGIVAQFPARFR